MLRAVRTTAQKTLSAVYVPARGMTLYYNPPPHVPHSSETIAKYKASKHLDQIPLVRSTNSHCENDYPYLDI